MTERNAVWAVTKRYLGPYLLLRRVESKLGLGWPDVFYRCPTNGVAGWIELKLFLREGKCPAHFTLDQLLFGEIETAAKGRWFLLARAGPAWLLYDAPGARRLYEGDASSIPLFRVTGRYPVKEMLQWLTR